MKRIAAFLAALTFATSAFAGGGAGFYQHFNGLIKFFPQGTNGQAWTFLYTSPPVVPPVVPPVTPPVTPPTVTPPAAAPQASQPVAQSSGRSLAVSRMFGWASMAGVAQFWYFAACQVEKRDYPDSFFARTCWHPVIDLKRMEETERQLDILRDQVN